MSTPDQAPAAAAHEPHARVARNALYLLLGQLVTTALGIAINAVLARKLGAADFGLLYLVTTAATFAYIVVEWGQASYVVAEVARRRAETGTLVGTSLALRAGGALVASALTLAGMALLGYDRHTLLLAALLLVANLPLSLSQGLGMVFRGYERMDLDALSTTLARFLAAAAIVPTLALGGRIVAVIGAQGVAALGALLATVALARRLSTPPLQVRRPVAREILWGGAPLLVFTVGVNVQQYIDAVLISKLAPTEVVGWYGAARGFLGPLVAPVMMLSAALYPRFSALSTSDPARFQEEARASARPLILIGVLISIGTYLFADVAIALVYSKRSFGPAVPVLQLMAPFLLLVSVNMFLVSILTIVGRRREQALAKILAMAAGIALTMLLIPWSQRTLGNGGLGAALAVTGSEAVMLVFCLLLLPRGLFGRRLWTDLGKALLAGALAVGVGLLAGPLHAALRIPAVLAAFGAAAAAFGLVARSDVELVRAVIRKRRGA